MAARLHRQKRPDRPGTDPAADGTVPIDEVGGDASSGAGDHGTVLA